MAYNSDRQNSLLQFLAVNRTVAIVLVAVLFFGLGEELWGQFMPVYLRALTHEQVKSATSATMIGWQVLGLVGLYACLRNLFEGICYIGGGQLTARLGDRGSLMLFGLLTLAGYGLFLVVTAPWAAVLAALLILGWEPLSVPVTFTTVGATVDTNRRGMAFAVQSIQKRLPKILGPLIAGFVLGYFQKTTADPDRGRILGMHWLVAGAMVLGLGSVALQFLWMPHREAPPPGPAARVIVHNFHPTLRRLLLAEVFTRWCDWLVREFVVLYLLAVRGVPVEEVGMLFAVQNISALLTYLPIGRLTQNFGLQPFIGVTFVFFALFPLVLALAPDGAWLAVAFVVYGLREIGEPARKALITSLLPEEVRARGVGLYWGLRSFAICWASLAGALVWHSFGPQALLYGAFACGCIGAAIFYLFCRSSFDQPSASAGSDY